MRLVRKYTHIKKWIFKFSREKDMIYKVKIVTIERIVYYYSKKIQNYRVWGVKMISKLEN
jgi:hypothetical protein